MALFDWVDVQNRASGLSAGAVSISGMSRVLIVDALMVMIDRWRWVPVSDAEWDELDAAVAEAINEILAGFVLVQEAFVDEFDRADGALGADYATTDFLDLGIQSAVILNERMFSPSSSEAGAYIQADTFGPDLAFTSEMVIGLAQAVFWYIRLEDAFSSGITGYRIMSDLFSSISIQRIENSTTNTTLATETLVNPLVTGDMIRIEAIGAEITVYLNDVQIIQHTDTTPIVRAGNAAIVLSSDNIAIERLEIVTL